MSITDAMRTIDPEEMPLTTEKLLRDAADLIDAYRTGVWVTFRNEPYENYWEICPHASEADALAFLSEQGNQPLHLVRFVPFGKTLDEVYES